MDRNIKIAYILGYLKNSWFWLGVWVFYYLRFTNYAGIGLIETVMIITMTVFEIPTGAVADLFGRKRTLILSFFLSVISNLYMALSQNFSMLLVSVFIGSVGATLYSGTMDALVYDTLKEKKQENLYDKIVANLSSIQLIAIIICGLVSGYLYTLNPSFPFFISALFYFFGFILCFFLREPKIDSIKFSIQNFLQQTKKGFRQLFINLNSTRITLFLFSVAGILTIADEMGETILSYEYGILANQIGLFFALIFLIAAFISQLTPFLNRHFDQNKLLVTLALFSAFTFIISPFIGLLLGAITLVVRQALATTFSNLSTIIINQSSKSTDRATTISSFNLLKNLPYVISAYLIGYLMDIHTAKLVYFYLGILMAFLIFIQTPFLLKSKIYSGSK